jgi:alkylation response protein AidB-like acyl-CoA dehydrogenase
MTNTMSDIRFDRDRALGFRDGPLDGLSCVQRYMEAQLHARGYSARQVAQTLAGPVDLLRRRSSSSDLGSASLTWTSAADGRHNWPVLGSLLERGTPVVIRPDRFWWPGNTLTGKSHRTDHFVLATGLDGATLRVLDTQAPTEDGYIRHLAVCEDLKRACRHIATMTAPPPPPLASPDAFAARVLPRSIEWLTADISALRAWFTGWDSLEFDELSARCVQIAALSDFQPQVFVLSQALADATSPGLTAVRMKSAQVAALAKALAYRLIVLHRYAEPARYRQCKHQFDRLIESLDTLLAVLCRAMDTDRPAIPPRPATDVIERLNDIALHAYEQRVPACGGREPSVPMDLSAVADRSGNSAKSILERLEQLAKEHLAPLAADVDTTGVPASHIARLADIGVFGITAPAPYSSAAGPEVTRGVSEILSGACGVTRFVHAQHALATSIVASSSNLELRQRWLPELCSGTTIAGNAVGHVCRPGEPVLSAVRSSIGWTLVGHVPWYTGWGVTSIGVIAAQTNEDTILLARIDTRKRPGLSAGPELPVVAMQGAHTVSLTIEGLEVEQGDVVAVIDRQQYIEDYHLRTANVSPAVFGLLNTVLQAMTELGTQRGMPAVVDLAAQLTEETRALRIEAYNLADNVNPTDELTRRLEIRGAAAVRLNQAASAYLAACGGRGTTARHPAQRWARESLFYLVQAQTPVVRDATLLAFRIPSSTRLP